MNFIPIFNKAFLNKEGIIDRTDSIKYFYEKTKQLLAKRKI